MVSDKLIAAILSVIFTYLCAYNAGYNHGHDFAIKQEQEACKKALINAL